MRHRKYSPDAIICLEERALLSMAAPSLTTQPSPTVILTTATTQPILTDTALLAGGNHETGTLAFVLTIVPQSTTVPSYTVTTVTDKVAGDGLYYASYKLPPNYQAASWASAGNYTWSVTYSGDTANKPISTAVQSTIAVETATVYATLDGNPITQYWYYPTAEINNAALLYHVNLNQPIGYFGTNPNAPPTGISTSNGTLIPNCVGPTYSSTPTPTPSIGISPSPGH
jgi:hypothetical protein